jgi:hypothetical protein
MVKVEPLPDVWQGLFLFHFFVSPRVKRVAAHLRVLFIDMPGFNQSVRFSANKAILRGMALILQKK